MDCVNETVGIWERVCDAVAEEILQDCGIGEPPVDPMLLAERLRIPVAYDNGCPGRGRLQRLAGRTTIFVRPEPRRERLHWTVAHEIGEAVAHRVFDQVGADPCPRDRERIANVMASRLLLPSAWFLCDASLLDGDVPALKERYGTASHELILLNLLRLSQLTLVTVFDHGRITRRRGNGQLHPPPLLPAERAVWQHVQQHEEPDESVGAGVRVQGWPVYEPGWRRELLRTTAVEEIDAVAVIDDDNLGWNAEHEF